MRRTRNTICQWLPGYIVTLVLVFLLGLASGLTSGCASAPVDTSHPCYSEEHGRILPPVYGTDC